MTPFKVGTPLVVIAQQRSGTNYFRSLLDSLPYFFSVGEIFEYHAFGLKDKPEQLHERCNFFRFRAQQFAEHPELSFPSADNLNTLFDRFLAHLQLEASKAGGEKKSFLLDVKYNSLHALNRYWYGPGQRPFFLEMLQQRGIPCIHLIRKDSVAREISHMLADKSDKWSFLSGEQGGHGVVKLSVEEFRIRLLLHNSYLGPVQSWLADMDCLELYYENMVPVDLFTQNTMPELEKFLGIALPGEPKSVFRKGLTDVRATIENLDELLAVAEELGVPTALV